MYRIQGYVVEGFEPVRELFENHFRSGCEDKANLCVYVGDEKVVDLTGTSGPASDKTHSPDALQLIFSSSKTVTSVVMAMLVDRGLIGYEDKVSKHWPEFANNGKQDVRIMDVLRHESGLAWVDHTFDIDDLHPLSIKKNAIGTILEKQPLRFVDGNRVREYHVLTRGFVCNEIVRRVDPQRRTIGEFIHDELFTACGIDVHLGVDKAGVAHRNVDMTHLSPGQVIQESLFSALLPFRSSRVPSLWQFIGMLTEIPVNSTRLFRDAGFTPTAMLKYLWSAFNRPAFFRMAHTTQLTPDILNCQEYVDAEMPSGNMRASARGLAKLAAFMANKGRLRDEERGTESTLFRDDVWQEMHDDAVVSNDLLFGGIRTEFTKGGINHYRAYSCDEGLERRFKGDRQGFYGWHGLGGSTFQWSVQHSVGFAYLPTRFTWYDIHNTNAAKLQKAVVECVEARNNDLKTVSSS